ncbi:MAG: peptidylprolyl isomerase [Paracoccaceae bacterium]
MKFLWLHMLGALALIGYLDTRLALAQGQFDPAILVNEDAITGYELEQRELFLRALKAPGDVAVEARKGLIEDRLKLQAARAAGIEPLPEGIESGMEEFAKRANLSKDQFVAELERVGVSKETYRDFVSSGIVWREVVRQRFGRQAQVSEAEIDRALQATGDSGVRVLISELIMPASDEELPVVMERAERIAKITSIEEFSEEARKYSAAATRENGGKLDWLPLANLPPLLRPQLLTLTTGEVTAPIPVPNAVALFQLRGIQETTRDAPRIAAVEYATYYIPGGRSDEARTRAAELRAEIDTCDDLYRIAFGQPESVLSRESQKPAEIPRDIALELAKLDDDEISTALTTADGQALVFLMLCGRSAEISEDASREDVASSLRQRRLNTLSQSYLDQLQAEARIVEN